MINEEQNRKIKYIESVVIAIYNKLMGKEILYSMPTKSSIHVTMNTVYPPNSFGLSNKLPPKRQWKNLAKRLYMYKDATDKLFFCVSPNKIKEIKHLCKTYKYFDIIKEELYIYRRKDNTGWTDYLPLANESLGKFHKLTIKFNEEIKVRFTQIHECKLIMMGVLLSTLACLIIEGII